MKAPVMDMMISNRLAWSYHANHNHVCHGKGKMISTCQNITIAPSVVGFIHFFIGTAARRVVPIDILYNVCDDDKNVQMADQASHDHPRRSVLRRQGVRDAPPREETRRPDRGTADCARNAGRTWLPQGNY